MVQSADDGSDGSGPRIITHVDDSRTLATGKLTMSGATAGMDDASKQNSGGGGGGAEAAAAATEGAGKSQGQQQTKQTELAFKLYDKDKDGYITKTEMEKLSKNLTKEQIEKVFARFDADGDGRLSYAEFRKMMMK